MVRFVRQFASTRYVNLLINSITLISNGPVFRFAGLLSCYLNGSYSMKCTFWKEPIHLILKDLKLKHKLQWLRISMLYHRFPNMRDVFQSQLSAKMIENVESLDFNTRACNCRSPSGTCLYGNVCRVPIVVYKVKCKTTGKIYIGNTQQYFKNRMR
jgi:hypothetical protein